MEGEVTWFLGGERMRISHRHQSIDKVYRTLTANLLLMTGKDQKKIAEPHGEAGKLKSLGEIPQLFVVFCRSTPQLKHNVCEQRLVPNGYSNNLPLEFLFSDRANSGDFPLFLLQRTAKR